MERDENECNGKLMFKICKGINIDEGDINYFIDFIKDKDFSIWFRFAVESCNFKIADNIIDLGYDINNDNKLIDEFVDYMDREKTEKINYLLANGFMIDYKLMERIESLFHEHNYYHKDDGILDFIKSQYRRQKMDLIKRRSQKNKSC